MSPRLALFPVLTLLAMAGFDDPEPSLLVVEPPRRRELPPGLPPWLAPDLTASLRDPLPRASAKVRQWHEDTAGDRVHHVARKGHSKGTRRQRKEARR